MNVNSVVSKFNASPACDEQVEVLKEAGLHFHHSAWGKGYEPRTRPNDRAVTYRGKFGTGVKVHMSSESSTQYHRIAYWVL